MLIFYIGIRGEIYFLYIYEIHIRETLNIQKPCSGQEIPELKLLKAGGIPVGENNLACPILMLS